jgi:glycosyltransferase involved in cell wall biosynthesis
MEYLPAKCAELEGGHVMRDSNVDNAGPVKVRESDGKAATWWFDVSSLFIYFSVHRHPSGIQRVMLNVLDALRAEQGKEPSIDIRLVRVDLIAQRLREVDFSDLDALLARSEVAAPRKSLEVRLTSAAGRLPPRIRRKLVHAYHRVNSLRAKFRESTYYPFLLQGRKSNAASDSLNQSLKSSDVLINLGHFSHPHFEGYISPIMMGGNELFVVNFIYDVIPAIHPEWTGVNVTAFMRILEVVTNHSDLLLCSSTSVLEDLDHLAKRSGNRTPPRIAKVRFGDLPLVDRDPSDNRILKDLGLDHPYVAIVGTIEIRKNHALALRAWRELSRKYGDSLPRLVFVGRWGWKVADLRAQLEETDYFNGLVKVLPNLSDHELQAVYRGARFTLFPSLYEGWGLPVTESHAHGKVCVAANNSSIPEAAGGLAVLFEDDCRRSLIEAVEPLLFDDARLQELEERIARDFVPVPWSRTWSDIRSAVQAALLARAEAAEPPPHIGANAP